MRALLVRPTCLVAVLSVLCFAACSLDPKNGCNTKDDCVSDHECIAGTCQRPSGDAGQDARDELPNPEVGSGSEPDSISQPGRDAAGDGYDQLDLAPAVADAPPDGPPDVPTDAAPDGPADRTPDSVTSPVDQPSDDGDRLDSDIPDAPEGPIDSGGPSSDASDGPMAVDADVVSSLDAAAGGDLDSAAAWELTSGAPTSEPAVTSRGTDQGIDVFWRGPDDRLKHQWRGNDDSWSAVEDLGGTLASRPAAVTRTTNVQDVFWRGTDNHLKHKWHNDGSWSEEEDLGGLLASSPTALSWGTIALRVFWQDPDGKLKHKSMDYATGLWTVEADLGVPVQSDPAALYRNNGVADVFWRGPSGTLQHAWTNDGTSWLGPQDLGGAIAPGSFPAATSRREGWIDLFWRGTDNHLKHIWMNPSSHWSMLPEDLGGQLTGSPAATFQDLYRLDIFAADARTGNLAYLVWTEGRPTGNPVTLNDTDPRITYSNGWLYSPERWLLDLDEDVHYATVDGSYFELTFTGTGVDYVTEREAHEGRVDISIDGVSQRTVDCYDPARWSQQVVYSKTGLSWGPHTIRVTKRDGQYILLDALRIYP